MKKQHVPVLLQEVITYLEPQANENFVDATLGFAGHAKEILSKTAPNGVLIGIDQDEEALESAKSELDSFGDRFKPFYGNFDRITEIAGDIKITGGILADLGVSSMQIDENLRGFSFQKEGPLDMRMSKANPLTAEEIVNEYPVEKIAEIIKKYSDERFAGRIAKRIEIERQKYRITDTLTFAKIVSEAIPRRFWPKGINPATRTFQAIRIAVNDELGALERFLPQALEILERGSRLAIISFHGLEDEIVKRFFQENARGCICPPNFPKCVCGHKQKLKVITKKAIRATEEEVDRNPRSRSAKLRIAEKI
jgi:16S rRNA (cytosine1402-N4)-methyltransferase